jgi:hypothetical protein
MFLSLALGACRKHEGDPVPTSLRVSLSHGVHNSPLVFDSLIYQNGAGEQYSISRLYYFLSNITFYQNNAAVYILDTIAYIDAKHEYSFNIPDLQPFSYDSVSYSIGVPAAYNTHGKLPPTFENVAMEWPDAMGGGYHFLKLEGHWRDAGSIIGYTVHLGTDPYIVQGGFRSSNHITANRENSIALRMDIGEWLEHPHIYSFSVDGVYTMGIGALMQKISENGRDVMQIIQ